jgi:hypothetical protein
MKIRLSQLKRFIREESEKVSGSLGSGAALDPASVKEVIKKFPKGIGKMGIDATRVDSFPVLGTGTRGTALDIGDDRVLKVTNDDREVAAAGTLVGQRIKNIVNFYSVFKFGDTGLFGIVQEKLKPLPKADAKLFNDALVATGLPIWIKRAEGSWDKVKQLTKEYVVSQVRKKFRDDLGSDEAKAYASDINQKWNVLVTRFGLRDMFNVLTELGIDFHDYHAGNMMLREDGTLVLIDLGMSKVKSPGKIDTISERKLTENHLKKIIKEELARLDARERSNVWRRISDTRTARRSLTVGC